MKQLISTSSQKVPTNWELPAAKADIEAALGPSQISSKREQHLTDQSPSSNIMLFMHKNN